MRVGSPKTLPGQAQSGRPQVRRCAAFLSTAVVVLGLAACGGGGDVTGSPGGGNVAPSGSVRITAANQDAVSRAAAVATVGGLSFDVVRVITSRDKGPVARWRGARALTGRQAPAGVVVLPIETCSAGGTMAATLDDRDGSLTLTTGDVLNVSFTACRETANAQADGSLSLAFGQLSAAPTLSLQAQVTMVQFTLSSLSSSRSVRYDGALRLTYAEPAVDTTVSELLVGGADTLTMAVTHPLYTDTVTLRPGFAAAQYGFPPGPAGPNSLRTRYEINGQVASKAAGGWVSVFSTVHLWQYVDVETHPSSGMIQVNGELGRVMLTVESAQDVRVDLDTDTGTIASKLVPWDELV